MMKPVRLTFEWAWPSSSLRTVSRDPGTNGKPEDLADEILESLHRLAMNLRPASLDHLGLVGAPSLVQSTEERSQIAPFKAWGPIKIDQRGY
jgi:signal transduction histidine kinase